MEEDAPPTDQQRRNARHVSYVMYYLAGAFAVGAILNLVIIWWYGANSRASIGAISLAVMSGYMFYQARHFCDEGEKSP